MRRTEATWTEVVEVVDVNKPSKGMFRQMLECFLGIGCIKSKVNETVLYATETESFCTYYRNAPINKLPICAYTCMIKLFKIY